MKKVIRLTESDLVNIVKRVINEQTEQGPVVPKTIKIPNDIPKDFGLSANSEINSNEFLEKLKNSPIGINAFHIKQEFEFPIYPVYANIGNFRFSFEPFDKENGQYRLRWTKSF